MGVAVAAPADENGVYVMKSLLGCLAAVLVSGSVARADEMDRETKSKPSVAVATAAPSQIGSELDKESPDQSHGWRRGGWGGGYSYGYGGGWGGGYRVGYYGGGWGGSDYGGWHRPWGGYGYSVSYYPTNYYPSYSTSYYSGCW